MKQFRDLSICWKLILLAVFTSLLVLSGTTVVYSVLDHRTAKAAMIERYSTTADILGRNCLASLEFADSEDANTVLSSLKLDDEVASASLFDAKNLRFAAFLRDGYDPQELTQVLFADGTFGHDGFLHLIRPVMRDTKTVGTIYLRIRLQQLTARLRDQLRLSLIVLGFSVLVSTALAGALQRVISMPVLQLLETARRVVHSGDYSVRARQDSKDELGELVGEFNEMLAAIESRDTELIHHRENLTELVHQRTAELEKRTEEAMAASVAKSDFLANMSHEIRTPLNAIMGYTDLLRRGWSDSPEEREDMLSTVHSSGRHLMTVINDILDLSKIESGRFDIDLKPESPHSILSDVVSLMRVQFREKDLTLDYNWEGLVPETILTDGQRLRQILLNLVGNARKFTLKGGVRLIARVVREPQSELVIDIIDTGVGIPLDKQDQIFEPFMQADTSVTRKFGGTGLGLSISRRLARLMGGNLTVQSSPGAGSDFRLTIATGDLTEILFQPMNAVADVIPSSSTSRNMADESSRSELKGTRVLLVDDGDSNRKLISLILKRAGAVITEACNGQEACHLAIGGHTFDVILLDMQMPIMDGYTAAGKMRTAGITSPIIALTAHAMKEDREKCLNAGCSDYLTKPVSADELLERMRSLNSCSTKPKSSIIEPNVGRESIRSNLPIDDQEFAEIVVDFIAALRREVSLLTTAIKNRDVQKALTGLHWIKGAAGTAGFGCFTAPCVQMTMSVHSDIWTDVDCLLLTIQDYASRVETPDLELVTA